MISFRFLASAVFFAFGDEIVEEFENFVTYKLQNFVSDVGGLLGLFMGCSLLSIMEIIFLLANILITSIKKISRTEQVKSVREEFNDEKLEVRMRRIERQMFDMKDSLKRLEESSKSSLRVEDL